MPQVKELLIDGLKDLLHAEGQLTEALPKMAAAARHPKLKDAFDKHLVQTQGHITRLKKVFELLGEQARSKPCKAMMGLIQEGEETIAEGRAKKPLAADLSLIAAAQKVEHYEIASYGTARVLARQIGEIECARLLTHTLGEEEGADFVLTAISDPLLQQAMLDDGGAPVNLETVGKQASPSKKAVSGVKSRKA